MYAKCFAAIIPARKEKQSSKNSNYHFQFRVVTYKLSSFTRNQKKGINMLYYLEGLTSCLPWVVRHRNDYGANVITLHATSEAAELERKWRKLNGAENVRKIHISQKELAQCTKSGGSTQQQQASSKLPDIRSLLLARTSTAGKSGTHRLAVGNTGRAANASRQSA